MKVAKSCGASQSDVASGCAGQRALQKLVDEIIQLGHIPTQSKNASVAEKRLAQWLSKARKAGSLTREQEAALDKLPQASKRKVVQHANRTRYGQRSAEKGGG